MNCTDWFLSSIQCLGLQSICSPSGLGPSGCDWESLCTLWLTHGPSVHLGMVIHTMYKSAARPLRAGLHVIVYSLWKVEQLSHKRSNLVFCWTLGQCHNTCFMSKIFKNLCSGRFSGSVYFSHLSDGSRHPVITWNLCDLYTVSAVQYIGSSDTAALKATQLSEARCVATLVISYCTASAVSVS